MDKDQARGYSLNMAAQAAEVLGESNEEAWRLQDALDVLYDALVEGGVPPIYAGSAVVGMATSRMLYRGVGGE